MTIWDKIATLSPTKDAAIATSGGDQWELNLGASARHWKAPPAIRLPHCHATLKEGLIGVRIGRLTVLGVVLGTNPKKPAVWLCRCLCGDYAGYRATALRHAKPDFACQACERVKGIQIVGARKSTSATRELSGRRLDALAQRRRA